MFLHLVKLKLVLASIFLLITTSAISSEKKITYLDVLQNPNDLDLNMKYAELLLVFRRRIKDLNPAESIYMFVGKKLKVPLH